MSYATHEWGERLRAIACPTLVTWGEADALIPVRHADEYARLIPGARVVRFSHSGHLPMIEEPRAFSAALLEFLDSVPQHTTSENGRSRQ
jgi:pimeloyl-ACP methyl ester carboxylesterase